MSEHTTNRRGPKSGRGLFFENMALLVCVGNPLIHQETKPPPSAGLNTNLKKGRRARVVR